MAEQAMSACEEQRRVFSAQSTAEAVQKVYWDDSSRRKRPSPTPVASSTATPAEPQPVQPTTTPHQDATLVIPWAMQDNLAAQATAAHLGIDINDPNAMQSWLDKPIRNNTDVLTVLRSYHDKVIHPEMYRMVVQLDTALKALGDGLFATSREVEWMGAENRLMQKHQSGVQLVTSGWPTGLGSDARLYQICWTLSQCPKITTFLQNRAYNTDHPADLLVSLNVLAALQANLLVFVTGFILNNSFESHSRAAIDLWERLFGSLEQPERPLSFHILITHKPTGPCGKASALALFCRRRFRVPPRPIPSAVFEYAGNLRSFKSSYLNFKVFTRNFTGGLRSPNHEAAYASSRRLGHCIPKQININFGIILKPTLITVLLFLSFFSL